MARTPKAGDYIEAITTDETIKGILLESPEIQKDTVIIKLDSGYNIGIDKSKIKKISTLQQTKKEAATAIPPKEKQSNLPKITILHTGGTIASKVDYRTGGVVSRFKPEEIVAMFPEIRQIAQVDSRLIGNMFSEDMRFAHYNIMAKEIQKEAAKGTSGVIITHGTDTMHYTSAALAFILENLPIPVILVGAQRSSDRGSSDAALNLLSAAYFITNSDFTGVAICMHENMSDKSCLILPATKTRKMHTSRRDAFRPINTMPIARVDFEEKGITYFNKDYARKPEGKLALKLMKENLKIGILKAHPNMFAQEVKQYSNFDGLIIEGTGLGQISITHLDKNTAENAKIMAEIRILAKKIPVVMAPQTIYGRIQMNVYSTARELQNAGVLGNMGDMTPETAFVKLAWLLSNYKKSEVKELIGKNLRGEISERTEEKAFLN